MLISYLEYQQVASGINKHMMKTEDRPSNELASTTKTTQKKAPERHKILVHVVNSHAYFIITEEPGPKRPIAPTNCTRAPKCDASPLIG